MDLTVSSWVELMYWASAIFGGVFFVLRAASMIIGGDLLSGDVDGDFDADIDLDMDGDADLRDIHTGHDTDAAFKLFSLQGLTGFFMMFGLVGLTLLSTGMNEFLTMVGAGLAGYATMWITAKIFQLMLGLRSDGTLRLSNAIGEHGSVYLTIPANGSGQVQVTVQGSLKIFDAVSEDKKKISTGVKIEVVDIADNNTLVVKKLN